MKNIAFVPARGGSKSIPLKNIKPFCGQPLIYWCLKALQEANSIDEIYVATESDEIIQAIDEFKFDKVEIFHRSSANAQDQSPTEAVMLEFIEQRAIPADDNFILVQATSPLTQARDFDSALKLLEQKNADSLLSCTRIKRFFWTDEGQAVNYDFKARPRRQDFAGSLVENGAFYINKVQNITKEKNRIGGKIAVYEMPEYTFIELDEEDDWAMAEILMRKHFSPQPPVDKSKIKLLLSDVDGVLTDAGMYYTENGDELKKFSTYDGMGFKILKENGIKVGILTSEDRKLNGRRAEKMKLDYAFHGIKDKLPVAQSLCDQLGIGLEHMAYIGDDINDLELLQKVGVAACPANARAAIKSIPGIIQLKTPGGQGALRELVEIILKKY